MVTRIEQRLAAVAALCTAALLATGLLLFDGGPPTSHGGVIRSWFAANAVPVRLAALIWLGATIALVIFAVAVREAIWATILDRNWAAMLFVQGAVGFAAVAVVVAAVLWTLAELASAEQLPADVAAALWAVARTLLRFATWGLTVPLVVIGLVLYRYSTLGQFGTVTGLMVAVGLLVPATWAPSLYAFAAWLVLAGITFLRPMRERRRRGLRRRLRSRRGEVQESMPDQ